MFVGQTKNLFILLDRRLLSWAAVLCILAIIYGYIYDFSPQTGQQSHDLRHAFTGMTCDAGTDIMTAQLWLWHQSFPRQNRSRRSRMARSYQGEIRNRWRWTKRKHGKNTDNAMRLSDCIASLARRRSWFRIPSSASGIACNTSKPNWR